MPLYIIEVADEDPGRLSWRAVQRLRDAEAVEVDSDLAPRFASLLPPRTTDALALARAGKTVARLTARPAAPPVDVPYEILYAAPPDQACGTRPLEGMGVVVTRPRDQAEPLLSRLEALGARAYGVPSIVIEPRQPNPELDDAVAHIGRYQWLIFTSANAVPLFMAALRDARALAGLRIACIGPATAAALQSCGLEADLVPERFVAEGLLDVLPEVAGHRFLLPRAEEAREILPETLRQRGAEIDVIPVYRTHAAPAEPAQRLFAAGLVDAVTFTASSTVRHFPDIPPDVAVVCIGPVTAQTARDRGWTVAREADVYTTDGVIAALIDLRRTRQETQKSGRKRRSAP